MSLRIARRLFGPLLTGGLLLGISLSGPLTLFAQFVPVGPPMHVDVGNLSKPAANAILPIAPAQGDAERAAVLFLGYDGISFLGSTCGCLPPDTNAAVGNNFVVETVNVRYRV